MEINIEDYLTNGEIKTAIVEQLKSSVARHFEDEKAIDRIITNTAYEIVHKMCDDVFDEDLETVLKEKVLKILSDLSSYSVFKKPDAWCRETNKPYDYLQSCIQENHSLIKEKVREVIEKDIPRTVADDLKGDLEHVIFEAITDRLFKSEK